jgi:two-component system cell cycle response regulator CtrA
MRVLVAEDDPSTMRGISRVLKNTGAIVEQTDTGEEALELVKHYDFDIIILDLTLRDMDGYDVVRRMRASRLDTPVLILSGPSRPDPLKAFTSGADEFMVKPFDNAELLARVQAVVRRSKGFSNPRLCVGPLMLDLNSGAVTVAGQRVDLTRKEFLTLELMVLRRGTVLTKEAFLSHLYGGKDEPEMKIIDVFICKIRKKLARAGANNLVETVWGRGYMVRNPSSATGASMKPRWLEEPQTTPLHEAA